MFILIQYRAEENLCLPFSTLENAISYAMAEIKHFDDEEGVIEFNEDEEFWTINSDACEDPYVITKEEVDQRFTS